VTPTPTGSRIRQTAEFDPIGLTGLAYWYAVFPLHEFVFDGMLNAIARVAQCSNDVSATSRPTLIQKAVWLVGLITVCFAAAGLGSAATSKSVAGWYQTLVKPSWNPPNWLFGPVWTTLYLMMAIAAWLVWKKNGWRDSRSPMTWFGIQLALNVLWSYLFFGMQRPDLAFVEIVLLWLCIVATCLAFHAKSETAAFLLVPYLAWTSFAVMLNFAIWRLNTS
jgi:tryptophan-rich sensory protein